MILLQVDEEKKQLCELQAGKPLGEKLQKPNIIDLNLWFYLDLAYYLYTIH